MNNKTIYLLAHGNTEALRKTYAKDHDFFRHPIPLMASDIEGGGKWVNRADDFVVIHRLTQHESEWMKTEIHVRNIRQTDYREIPHNAINPLKERPKVEQIKLKPNKSFDKDINHLHESKKTIDEDWLNDYMSEENFKI